LDYKAKYLIVIFCGKTTKKWKEMKEMYKLGDTKVELELT